MAPLPFIKLAAVLLKEVSKPLAAEIKRKAQEHAYAKRLAIVLGRSWERVGQRAENFVRGHRVKELKPINDTHALSVGADLISQSFLISTAIALILVEYWRSSTAAAAAAEIQKKEKAVRQAAKEMRLAAIEASIARLESDVRKVERSGVISTAAAWLPRLSRGADGATSLTPSSGTQISVDPDTSANNTQDKTRAVRSATASVALDIVVAHGNDNHNASGQHTATAREGPHSVPEMEEGEAAYAAAVAVTLPAAVTSPRVDVAPQSSASWWSYLWPWGGTSTPQSSSATQQGDYRP